MLVLGTIMGYSLPPATARECLEMSATPPGMHQTKFTSGGANNRIEGMVQPRSAVLTGLCSHLLEDRLSRANQFGILGLQLCLSSLLFGNQCSHN